MVINQYVGELVGVDPEEFAKNVKTDARAARVPTDNIKVNFSAKEGLTVLCTNEVANLIRKRKDVKYFRCNVVGFYEKKK